MNNEALSYLEEQVKMTGFPEAVYSKLSEEVMKGEAEFSLQHDAKYGQKEMDYILHFQKSKTTDNYFFNSFDAISKLDGKPENINRFYSDKRITAKEAFNLMEGRSVEKKYNHHEKVMEEGKEVYKPIKDSTYNVWVKVDFNDADKNGNYKLKTYGEKWGFDLEKKVGELPVKQLQNPDDRDDLLKSLKKGNVQSVTFEQNGQTESRYLEANPRARSINVYDSNMGLIEDKKQAKSIASKNENSNGQTVNESEAKDQKQSQKASVDTGDDFTGENPPKKKRTRQRV